MNPRRIAVSIALVLLMALALWLARRRADIPGASPEPAGTAGGEKRAPEAAPDAQVAVVPPVAAASLPEKRRGLWRIEPAEGTGSLAPQDWESWQKTREEVIEAWRKKLIDSNFENETLANVPTILLARSGLVLRLAPECDPDNVRVTFKASELNGCDSLNLIAYVAQARLTIGADGFAWLVPKVGRAACEPAWLDGLKEWEHCRQRHRDSMSCRADREAALKNMSSRKEKIDLVDVPLDEALGRLKSLFEVKGLDFEKTIPDEAYDLLHKQETGDFGFHRVTCVKTSATLEEVLHEILDPLALAFKSGTYITVLSKAKAEKEKEDNKEMDELVAGGEQTEKEETALLRAIKIRLDGSPFTAEELLTLAAAQADIPLQFDPMVRASTTRWKAVEAELMLGELMDEVAAGAGCDVVIRLAAWPDFAEPYKEGWALWVLARK